MILWWHDKYNFKNQNLTSSSNHGCCKFPSFCWHSLIHLWRRGSPMAGPKPQKGDSQSPSESLLESLSSWRSWSNSLVTVEHGGFNYVIGFHCSDCSWAFLSSSLSACIRSYNNQPTEATKMHPHRRSKQKETDSRVPWTKVCLFGFRYHASLNPYRPTWIVVTLANDLLTLQNNASLCWVKP